MIFVQKTMKINIEKFFKIDRSEDRLSHLPKMQSYWSVRIKKVRCNVTKYFASEAAELKSSIILISPTMKVIVFQIPNYKSIPFRGYYFVILLNGFLFYSYARSTRNLMFRFKFFEEFLKTLNFTHFYLQILKK